MKAMTTYSKVPAITIALVLFLGTLGVSSVYSADTVVLKSGPLLVPPTGTVQVTMYNELPYQVTATVDLFDDSGDMITDPAYPITIVADPGAIGSWLPIGKATSATTAIRAEVTLELNRKQDIKEIQTVVHVVSSYGVSNWVMD